MTITISPETEAQLRMSARFTGLDVSETADALLQEKLAEDAEERSDAIAGIHRGLDAVAAGRIRPLSEFTAQETIRCL